MINKLLNIQQILKNYKLDNKNNIIYSSRIAKLKPVIDNKNKGSIILVSAINPTKFGEGKTTVAIGLSDAINRFHKNSTILTLRQPSIGPTLGLKGGATGFNQCQVVPADIINYGLTGDFFYLETINNLICSLIDNHIYFGNQLKIDPHQILIKRCIDLSDRSLRDITLTISKKQNLKYQSGFDLTAASELMNIFAISKDKLDFIKHINEMLIAYTINHKPIYVKDLNINENLTILIDKIIWPNALSTLNNTLCLMHAGPFANIGCGYNSLIALNLAIDKAKYVVTEAGFGADLGCEKFVNIIGQINHTQPQVIVIVITVKSLLNHGKYDHNLIKQLDSGLTNLIQHLSFIKKINGSFVIAINHFNDDNPVLLSYLVNWLTKLNLPYAIVNPTNNQGFNDLAKVVLKNLSSVSIKPLYKLTESLENKINKVVKYAYGINRPVKFSKIASIQLKKINNLKYYLCMAKTPYSLSSNKDCLIKSDHDEIKIDSFRINHGAKIIIALTENIYTMPGLPKNPNAIKK